jgi:hypothetical protein
MQFPPAYLYLTAIVTFLNAEESVQVLLLYHPRSHEPTSTRFKT